ncbi:unnamed protein product [Amoebophrya sp. A25]|nr:unnamed protein product [Amoebophrya sp. A25]|eukprot:GSA25T00008793001.1
MSTTDKDEVNVDFSSSHRWLYLYFRDIYACTTRSRYLINFILWQCCKSCFRLIILSN